MIKKMINLVASIAISLVPLFALAPSVYAATYTCTWTGLGGDANFSTSGNWSGCNGAAPQVADSNDFVFDITSLSADESPNNDIVGMTANTIAFQGTGFYGFTIGGNAFTITGGITDTSGYYNEISTDITFSGNQTISVTSSSFTLSGILSGSGNLTKIGAGSIFVSGNNSAYSGNIIISAGDITTIGLNSLGDNTGSTTVADGARLLFFIYAMGTNPTISEPLIIAGDGDGIGYTNNAISAYRCASSGCTEDQTVTFSGAVVLTANTLVSPGFVMKFTGALTGSYTLGVAQGQSGTLTVASSANASQTANGDYKAPKVTTTLSDNQPAVPVSIGYNETVIITGTRQSVYVSPGGTLKGTGTIADVSVAGTIAPGLSPGCLNTGNLTLVSGSAYDFEVGGTTACTGYDQINVTGTVDLGSGTLNTSLYNGFKPAAGNTFTIISNDAADAVTGTFANLAEGATFTVDGYVLKISYKGGDGNDVVLTVQSVPASPDTGFKLLTSSPISTLLTTTLLAAGIALLAKRYNSIATKK